MTATTVAKRSGQRTIDQICSAVSPIPISVPIASSQRAAEDDDEEDRGEDEDHRERDQELQRAELVERAVLVDLPDLVAGADEGADVARGGVERDRGAEDQRDAGLPGAVDDLLERCAQRVDRRRLAEVADDPQQRVDGVLVAEHAEQRDEDDQAREDREHRVVGERRGPVAEVVRLVRLRGVADDMPPGAGRHLGGPRDPVARCPLAHGARLPAGGLVKRLVLPRSVRCGGGLGRLRRPCQRPSLAVPARDAVRERLGSFVLDGPRCAPGWSEAAHEGKVRDRSLAAGSERLDRSAETPPLRPHVLPTERRIHRRRTAGAEERQIPECGSNRTVAAAIPADCLDANGHGTGRRHRPLQDCSRPVPSA